MKTITRLAAVCTALLSLPVSAGIKDGALEIWVDKGAESVKAIAARFTEDTGIEVTVIRSSDTPGMFDIQAPAGGGPDILFWAHDRYGDWARSGLIQEVKLNADLRKDVIDYALDAVTVDNKVYGYPIAIEAVSILYNKALLDKAPATFEELFELNNQLQEKHGVSAITWDYNTSYFSWPLLAANGGYPFKKTTTGYDVADTGINHDGAKLGAKFISRLIKEGVMEKQIDYSIMDQKFIEGKTAMVINGPWYWGKLDKAGLDFGVAPLPTLNGNVAKPFVGVYGAALSSNTSNRDLAVEFIEQYLLKADSLKEYHRSGELGVLAYQSLQQELSNDPKLAAVYDSAEQGEIMPNTPQMARFWSAVGTALSNITSERQQVDHALDMAAKRAVR
ncbi:maltose/maltodextrin ABC transporter substrate-binding protein MalE [Corallincola platygyrae]|uniref:Maltodextrin-binding protein n=1 Tax=Corallincola platygyrae TaxID=1193278 RepID=A0ABW4XMC6_9GAMM